MSPQYPENPDKISHLTDPSTPEPSPPTTPQPASPSVSRVDPESAIREDATTQEATSNIARVSPPQTADATAENDAQIDTTVSSTPTSGSDTPSTDTYVDPGYVAVQPGFETAFAPIVASKPKRNKWLIVGIIAAAIILVLGGAYGVYALWYSNPTKVAADAAHQLITSKSSVTNGTMLFESGVDDERTKIEVTFASKLNSADINGEADARLKITGSDNKTYETAGAGMMSNSGAFYFKFDGVAKMMDQYLEDETVKSYMDAYPQLKTDIDTLVKKIDGSWVKVDQDFIREYVKNFDYNKTKQCFQKVYDTMLKDGAQQKQLREVYTHNEFLHLTSQGTQSINGTLTNKYAVVTDLSKAYDALIAYDKTDFAKAGNSCMKDLRDDTSSSSTEKPSDSEIRETQQEIDKVKTTAYIASFGHELKRLELNYADNESKTSFASRFDMSSNDPVDTKDPAKSIPLKEFQADVEKIMSEIMGATGDESESSSEEATPVVSTSLNKQMQDTERKNDLGSIQAQIENFAANNRGRYPTLDEINSASFRSQEDLSVDAPVYIDPIGSSAALVAKAQKGVYAYMPAPENNASCVGTHAECRGYKLIAILSDGKTEYVLES